MIKSVRGGSDKKAIDKEKFFLALSDRTRLRLLNLMRDHEVCVCFFVEVMRISQPKISRHLAYLRRAGVVAARREGKWMHYRLDRPTEPRAADALDDILAWLAEDAEMQKDSNLLVHFCCSPNPPEHLQGVPRPANIGCNSQG